MNDYFLDLDSRCGRLSLCVLGVDEPFSVCVLERVFVCRYLSQFVPMLFQVPCDDGRLLLHAAFRLAPGSLFRCCPPGALFDRDDDIRTLFPEPRVIQALDELRKRELPWFLPVVGKLPEPLWVHAEFARHLDMRVREVETLPRIDPDLQVARNPVLGHFPLSPMGRSPGMPNLLSLILLRSFCLVFLVVIEIH